MMIKRFIVVGGATGLAGLVLLLSLWAGSPQASLPTQTARDPSLAPDVVPYQPGQVITDPAHFGRDQLTHGAQGGTYVFEDDGQGRRTILTYHVITPQPQGVYDVEKPTAKTTFPNGRMLIVQADRGHFVAPENKLRQGAFEGHVVLSFYQTDGTRAPDLSTDDDVALRVFLQDAQFDMDLAQLESAGDLHVTGPRIDFRGRGLSLVYNDQYHRIQKLQVRRAKSLRFKPDTPKASSRPDVGHEDSSASAQTQPKASPVQFYRARFEERVTLTGSAHRVDMAGDYLTAFFSLEQNDTPSQQATSQPRPLAMAGRGGTAPINKGVSLDGRSLCPVSADDVILRWAGQLLVEPEMDPPADLVGPSDVLVQLTGTPFTFATAKGETVTGHTADFLTSSAKVRAVGNVAFPLRVGSRSAGYFTGTQVVINQQQASGYILGPGTLYAQRADDQNLQAHWEDRLDLTFFPPSQAGDSLEALASAIFHGPVTVTDPRFTLEAHDTLKLQLAQPVEGDQSLEQVHAQGEVHLHALNQDQSLTLEAQSLTIVPTHADADQPFETLTARGEVRVAVDDPAVVLQGDRLVMDTAADQLELTGSPASASARGSTLNGPRLVMHQTRQTLHVQGAGSFDTPLKPGQPKPRLAVHWSKAMDFDNLSGQANFQGDVLAQTRENLDITRLTTHQLALKVTSGQATSQDRVLETLTAKDDVVFISETYAKVDPRDVKLGLASAVPDKPDTRLTLKGPSLTFTNKPAQNVERIDVPGPGTMLLEDYRTAPGTSPASGFSGQGATLFLWDTQQTLDIHAYDMILTGNVQMLHRPLDPAASILQLDCQRLLVDLAPLAGFSASDRANVQLEVQRVEADERVRIVESDKTITADWLRYDARQHLAKLLAKPSGFAQVAIEDHPTALRAAELWWYLDKNRFEIRKPLGSVVPIPQ